MEHFLFLRQPLNRYRCRDNRVWIIETKSLIHGFRFNNSKQFSNSIILMSFCSSHLAIKNVKKIDAKINFKNSKFVYYNENMKFSKFQTQFSQKLQ